MNPTCVIDAVHVPVPVATIEGSASLCDAFCKMRHESIHHLVVVTGTKVAGVISDRDIIARGCDDSTLGFWPGMTVDDVMTPLQQFAHEGMPLSETLELMAATGTSALPIVNARGLAGIITESDLLRVLGLLLTEARQARPERAGDTVVLTNPLIQEAMRLLVYAGI